MHKTGHIISIQLFAKHYVHKNSYVVLMGDYFLFVYNIYNKELVFFLAFFYLYVKMLTC